MGRHDPLTLPEAWHQSKLALKKSIDMPSRGAEGLQVVLEAICEKIGLDLENVVAAPAPAPPILLDDTPGPIPEPPAPDPDPVPDPPVPPEPRKRGRIGKKATKKS